MINVMARNNDGSSGSPRNTVALTIPSNGVANRHSDVVTAGRLRLTIVIAQLLTSITVQDALAEFITSGAYLALCAG